MFHCLDKVFAGQIWCMYPLKPINKATIMRGRMSVRHQRVKKKKREKESMHNYNSCVLNCFHSCFKALCFSFCTFFFLPPWLLPQVVQPSFEHQSSLERYWPEHPFRLKPRWSLTPISCVGVAEGRRKRMNNKNNKKKRENEVWNQKQRRRQKNQ